MMIKEGGHSVITPSLGGLRSIGERAGTDVEHRDPVMARWGRVGA
jgi:hypothetical protein